MIDPTNSIRCTEARRNEWRDARVLSFFCLLLILSACGPTRQAVVDTLSSERRGERQAAANYSSADVESRLRAEVNRWDGTPHQLGGTTSRGIDCSAFVQNVYAAAFDVPLPRTTNDQVRIGTAVTRSDLQPGDLVFFNPPTKTRHVGIYLDDGEFAHASTSQGVTISNLTQDYWVSSYWTSRRILTLPDPPTAANRAQAIESRPPPNPPNDSVVDTPRRARIGW